MGSARGGRPKPHTGLLTRAPHRCQATPDPRGFLTAMDRVLFLSVGPSIKPRGSGVPASKLGLPTAVGHWLTKGRRVTRRLGRTAETSALRLTKPRVMLPSRSPP